MTSRRIFLRMGAVAVLGACTPGIPGKIFGQKFISDKKTLIPPGDLSDPILTLTSKHFEAFINTNFRISRKDLPETRNFRLIEVKDFTSKSNLEHNIEVCFSLLFKSENTKRIKGNIFNVSHNGLGEFRLSILPVTAEPDLYEAIISRFYA